MILGTFFFESICWEKWNTFWSQPEQNKLNFPLPLLLLVFSFSVHNQRVIQAKQCNVHYETSVSIYWWKKRRFPNVKKWRTFAQHSSFSTTVSRSMMKLSWSLEPSCADPRPSLCWALSSAWKFWHRCILYRLHNIRKRLIESAYIVYEQWAFKGE